MRNETRIKFEQYCADLASMNGVHSVAQKFTIEPSIQQTLETRMQESSSFLQRINMVGVPEQAGEKLGLGISGPAASTTNTATTDRETSDLSVFDANGYLCTQTNSDSHLTYTKLDLWAKFKDFQTRIRDALLVRQALDRIMIGWNGTSRAATSDKVANPLLQDVNKGWLQKYRDNAAARVMDEVVALSGVVKIGATGDYKNLDALVFDAVNNLIEPWFRQDPQLVVVLGSDLMADKYFPLINATQAPSEQLAADIVISQKRVGGKMAVTVPYFPANALMVTRLDNLSVYWQEGKRRRNIVENSKRDRVEYYESSNEAYVVEDYGCGCVVENITLV